MRGEDLNKKVGRTYSSASEAFRDADYATPIWRCETEWDRAKRYLEFVWVFACVVGVLYILFSIPLEAFR